MPLDLRINGRFLAQPVTGVQRYGRELLLAIDDLLAERNSSLEVELVVPPGLEASRSLKLRCIQIRAGLYPLSARFGRGWGWEQFGLGRVDDGVLLFCPANTAPLALLWRGAPIAVTIHSIAFRVLKREYRPAFRLAYEFMIPQVIRGAQTLITVSQAEVERIRAHFPEAAAKLRVIENGALPRGFPVRADAAGSERELHETSADSEPALLFVGSLVRGKNLETLSRVFRSVRTQFPGVRLKLVGPVPDVHEVDDLAFLFGRDDHVEWVGPVEDPRELSEIYATAHVLIHPSLYESSGLTPLEALASGCAVVVSDLPALRERLGAAASYACPHRPAEFAERVVELLRDPTRFAKQWEEARPIIESTTWRRTAERTLNALGFAI